MSETSKKLVFIGSAFEENTTDYQIQTIKELSKNSVVVLIRLDEDFSTFFLKKIIAGRQLLPILEKKNNYLQLHFFPFLPFGRFAQIKQLNIRISFFIALVLLRLNRKIKMTARKILWIFHPINFTTLYEINKIVDYSLYDCVDWFEYFPEEKSVSKMVDCCFVNSHVLFNKVSKFNKKTTLVPQGFRLDEFYQYSKKSKQRIFKRKPIIGYVGGINSRLEYKVLLNLVKNNPQWIFLLCGPVYHLEENKKNAYTLLKQSNVINYVVSKKNIPFVINYFDVAIIPYHLKTKFNRFSYPMKIFEYFYLGKPVVSSNITELRYLKRLVTIVKNSPVLWNKSIKIVLAKDWPNKLKNQQRKLAIQNSWGEKISKILRVIEPNL